MRNVPPPCCKTSAASIAVTRRSQLTSPRTLGRAAVRVAVGVGVGVLDEVGMLVSVGVDVGMAVSGLDGVPVAVAGVLVGGVSQESPNRVGVHVAMGARPAVPSIA